MLRVLLDDAGFGSWVEVEIPEGVTDHDPEVSGDERLKAAHVTE